MLLISMWHGVMAMAYSLLVNNITSQLINAAPNKKLLNYGYIEQMKDLLPSVLLAVFMGGCVFFVQYIGLPDILTLLIQAILGAVIYIGGSRLFKLDAFYFAWDMVKPVLGKVIKKK